VGNALLNVDMLMLFVTKNECEKRWSLRLQIYVLL